MASPLIVNETVEAELSALARVADAAPIHMPDVIELRKTNQGRLMHMARMTAQTVEIPVGFMVTYSLETGHPCGTARHMSMSVGRKGRVPNPTALWMVAQYLGFTGRLEDSVLWIEDLKGHGEAVNVVQPVKLDA